MAKQTQDLPSAIVVIKNFCRLLASHAVAEVTASYDGSGDSGNVDIMFRIAPPPRQTRGPILANNATVPHIWRVSREFFETPAI